MKMSEKRILPAVLVLLAFIGIGIAFAYIGMMNRVEIPSNPVEGITGQNETNERAARVDASPVQARGAHYMGKNETDETPELTEEQKEKAQKIALSDSKVQKKIGGKEYEIRMIQAHTLITQTGEHELI